MSGTAPLLLLAMPQMADPNFAKSVILLCDYTAEHGAFGLILNRQMTEPAHTLVKTEPPVAVDPQLHLWVGGPVEPRTTWVLMTDAQGPEDETREICPGLLLSVSHDLTLRLLQQPPSTRTRIIVGYAGWGPGQLEDEIEASSWLTLDVDPSFIFSTPADRLWETALRRLGTDPSQLQTSSGVH
jgi:putative transcriptional regulator